MRIMDEAWATEEAGGQYDRSGNDRESTVLGRNIILNTFNRLVFFREKPHSKRIDILDSLSAN